MSAWEKTVEKVNTVIFDLGRVLVRIHTGGEKFGRLMSAMGIEPEHAFGIYWHERELRQHMTGEIFSADFYRLARERYNLPHSYREFVEAWCDIFQPYPEMEEIFARVEKKHRVGILSDTDPLHWNYIINENPWLGRVEKPTLSFQVGFLKPHPAMFEAAADNCRRRKEECLFIDDVQENVDGARYNGMQAISFSGPEKLERDLARLGIL